ncbi:PorV/PorQ family protein [bacterium]|nr:PorV/PorQ family protein [bacterium]
MEKNQLVNLLSLNKLTPIILVGIMGTSGAFAQNFVNNVSKVGTTAGAIMDMPVNARGLAMGNAISGFGFDASVIHWNPAAIANTPSSLISASYIPWLINTDLQHIAVVFPVRRITVGGFITTWSMDDMPVRTEVEQYGTGEYFDAGDLLVALTVATSLTDRFSIGFNIKYLQERIWHSTAKGFAVDMGTIYKTDILNGLSIIAVITNYGTDMQMTGRDRSIFHDPDPLAEGNNEKIPADYSTDKWSLPLNFRFGIAANIIQNDFIHLQSEIDVLHPSNNHETIDVGIEALLRNLIYLRCGWSSLLQKDSIEGISVGAGLKIPMVFGSILIDYGFRDHGNLGILQAFTMGLIL